MVLKLPPMRLPELHRRHTICFFKQTVEVTAVGQPQHPDDIGHAHI